MMISLVIAPIRKLDVDFLWDLTHEIYLDAENITAQAEADTLQQIQTGIIQRTRTYILDEAKSLGADIQVVALKLEEDGFYPVQVELKGDISSYHRNVLSDLLQEDLGIAKEGQIWMD